MHTFLRRTQVKLTLSAVALISLLFSSFAAANSYHIGTGVFDITGEAAESSMFGYAVGQEVSGLQSRSSSHAYIIYDPSTEKRIVFVTADLGAIFQSVTLEVSKRLQARFGDLYTEENVMLTATHTHCASGGHAHHIMYMLASGDSTPFGYSFDNFEAVVNGVVQSIIRAHNNLTPGRVELVKGELEGVNRNRSIPAYRTNIDWQDFAHDTNNTMTLLKFVQNDGQEVGMLNWFAIHNTSISNKNTLLSSDAKGYAQWRFEKLKETDYRASKTFVAGFANSDQGDVVSAFGNANSKQGFEGTDDEWFNGQVTGEKQFQKAVELYQQGGVTLTGLLDYRHRWADFENYTVNHKYTLNGPKQLCTSAMGFSSAAGGENGPPPEDLNTSNIFEGMLNGDFNRIERRAELLLGGANPVTNFVSGLLNLLLGHEVDSNDPCQENKPVLYTTGSKNLAPETLPFQIFVVGELAIIGVPAELTTMAGRRIRNTVEQQLAEVGVTQSVIAGLANTYIGYVTTYEEFQAQHYEGASTQFGPYQFAAYQQEFDLLSAAIKHNTVITDDRRPSDLSQHIRFERPGVLWDNRYFWQVWGQVLEQPSSTYSSGATAKAVFLGGHPKNNLRTNDSFLFIQKLTPSGWRNYTDDRDWYTRYHWRRVGLDRSHITVEWDIQHDVPAGQYRIVHRGNWKNGWTGRVWPYQGTSNRFTVH